MSWKPRKYFKEIQSTVSKVFQLLSKIRPEMGLLH